MVLPLKWGIVELPGPAGRGPGDPVVSEMRCFISLAIQLCEKIQFCGDPVLREDSFLWQSSFLRSELMHFSGDPAL